MESLPKPYQTLSPARRTFVFLSSRCMRPLTLRNAYALRCEFSNWGPVKEGNKKSKAILR